MRVEICKTPEGSCLKIPLPADLDEESDLEIAVYLRRVVRAIEERAEQELFELRMLYSDEPE